VVIDVCLLFNGPVIFSATYFRFLLVKLNLWAIGMKIGEAYRTQASSLYSATPIGAPMHPAPIVMADRTRNKKSVKHNWLTMLGKHCLLAEGEIQCANISKGIVFDAPHLFSC
jgi:hypothetical protein